jgi:hypothetical protein
LRADLADRGHVIKPANWQADERFNGCWNRFKQIREEILVEENKILFDADGRSLTRDGAISILHSSGVPFEIRQKARKTLLHDELPGVEFSEEFLMEVYTRNRGEYLRQCKLNFFLDKPDLAKLLDREAFTKQLDRPHIINSQVSRLSQKIDLLAPIAQHLEDLASGREYRHDDPAVLAVQDWGVKNGYLFWALFGLSIKSEEIDTIGKRQNSAIATANKILKRLGYRSSRVRQVGGRGDVRISIYAVTNSECEHRQTIYQALTEKYKNYDVNSTQFDPVHTVLDVDSLSKNVCTDSKLSQGIGLRIEKDPPDLRAAADALALAAAHPTDYLSIVRDSYDRETLTLASHLLPADIRRKLRDLVLVANREVAA